MKKIYSSPHLYVVHHLKDVLESNGIDCIIQNENLAAAAGELPPSECWAELWVLDDAKYQTAREILTRILSEQKESERKEPWRCPRCGEELEGQFTECWRCGKSRQK
jgi:hypothetical protein